MDKKEFEENTYIDRKGYRVWKDSGHLVHRGKAYKEIYLKDRKKYPFAFSEYQVHHKDKNKLNNRTENLVLILRKEHEEKHGIIRREELQIIYMKIIAIGFIGIMGVEELSKRLGMGGIRKALMFMGVFFLTLVIALWLSREKEGKKYI